VVVGDALLDVHVTPSRPILHGGDVPASIRLEPGGQGANVAVRLARRRAGVRLVCATADDAAGRIVRAALAADGVEVVDLGADRTGIVVVLSGRGADRSMLSQRAPLLAATARGEMSALAGGSWLVVSGYALLESASAISATGDRPRRAVLGCALDAGEVAGWTRATETVRPHLLVLNADEARAVAGRHADPAGLALDLGARLGAVVAVTHAAGAAGVVVGEPVEVASPAGATAVDSTGAGDAFAAALVAELPADPWPPGAQRLRRALQAGVDLATAVAGGVGAQARVPGERRATLAP